MRAEKQARKLNGMCGIDGDLIHQNWSVQSAALALERAMDLNLKLDITVVSTPAVYSVTGGSRSGLDWRWWICDSISISNATSVFPTHDSSTDAYACDGHVYDAFALLSPTILWGDSSNYNCKRIRLLLPTPGCPIEFLGGGTH
ncbi:hypothetical protein SUGI_1494250 [Cryptomeria japonica]|uniref:Uncharacterized protein n=1 Tax=Cryptomeria japonica TaxID=3369 RepID=A0AAD3NPU0_CRYJA|nr:hypothetical protein SUGI_1224390 [Cryptomeria japonica]GLJ59148.1 hypothetical protein SUGI_1494250 [Cryptomeria japonica]